jgi:hypothetical protein
MTNTKLLYSNCVNVKRFSMVLILLFLAPSDYTALKTVLQTPFARQSIVNTPNVLRGVSNSLAVSELHTASG